jgi:hypothetical protein
MVKQKSVQQFKIVKNEAKNLKWTSLLKNIFDSRENVAWI